RVGRRPFLERVALHRERAAVIESTEDHCYRLLRRFGRARERVRNRVKQLLQDATTCMGTDAVVQGLAAALERDDARQAGEPSRDVDVNRSWQAFSSREEIVDTEGAHPVLFRLPPCCGLMHARRLE